VSQTYEAIEASANWLERDEQDVEQVCGLTNRRGASLTLTVVEGEQVPLKQIYVEGRNNKMACMVWKKYDVLNTSNADGVPTIPPIATVSYVDSRLFYL
jgi:hypothetical protein